MVCARRSCGRSVPPSLVVRIPYPCPNDIYEARVTQALARAKVEGIDPCGENGELHSCVVAGPMFTRRIEVKVGDTVERDAFAYADLLPV